jgi:hypothetical protein
MHRTAAFVSLLGVWAAACSNKDATPSFDVAASPSASPAQRTPASAPEPAPAAASSDPPIHDSAAADAADADSRTRAPSEREIRELARRIEHVSEARLLRQEDVPPALAEVHEVLKTRRQHLAACQDKGGPSLTKIDIDVQVGADGRATAAIRQNVGKDVKNCIAEVIGSLRFAPVKIDTRLALHRAE